MGSLSTRMCDMRGRNSPCRAQSPYAGSPRLRARGLLAYGGGCSLPIDLDGRTTTKADGAAVRRDHLDPQCILVLEVRGVAGLAQRIQARLLRTRGCGV